VVLPAGEYSIVAYAEGRETLTAEQTVVSGETGIVDVDLPYRPLSPHEGKLFLLVYRGECLLTKPVDPRHMSDYSG